MFVPALRRFRNVNIDILLARISNPAHKAVAVKVTDAANAFGAKVAAINESKSLTREGKAEAKAAALPDAIRDLATAARPLPKAKAKVAAARDAIRVPPLAKDDVVGFMSDSEHRAMFRTMSAADRAQILMQTKDAGLLAALLRGAPELSGLSASDEAFAKLVEDKYFTMTAGDKLAEIAAMESDIEAVDAAYQTARAQLRNLAGMDDGMRAQFETLAAPIERRVGALWIKRDKNINGVERVIVIDPDGADSSAADGGRSTIYRDATPAEVEAGVEYASMADYLATRAPALADYLPARAPAK
jgi:hypothetical protein